jgi:glutathione-regulated potassium-efflux system ancillary protein KefG
MTESARILLVFAHPALERAHVNPAMAAAVRDLPGLTLDDLYESYPDFTIDVSREQALLREHDLIVLQFPLYWYSSPSLLKEWLDLTWLRGFAYGRGGDKLKGKTLTCAVSTGGRPEAYRSEGDNRFSVEDFLRPFEQTARRCGMTWAEPFVLYGALASTPDGLARETARYRARLAALAAQAGRAAAA